jgi:hypothetical protein
MRNIDFNENIHFTRILCNEIEDIFMRGKHPYSFIL